MIIAREGVQIVDYIDDVVFLLGENEKTNNTLRKAIVMHNLLAKSMWKYKIRNISGIPDTYSHSDIITIE